MEDITDTDYTHGKRVSKDFKIKNLREYYDFYVQSRVLLLADVLEDIGNMVLKNMNFTLRLFLLQKD